MSGKKQHIIPQFLIKGFVSRANGKQKYIHWYRKGSKPCETNITNVMSENYFYGKEGELSADDEITAQENEKYAPLLEELRAKPVMEYFDDQRVAELIAHLCMRTKNLRDSMRESTEYLLDGMLLYFSDFQNLKRLCQRNPEILEAELKKNLGHLTRSERRAQIRKAMKLAPRYMDIQKEDTLIFLNQILLHVKSVLPNIVKQSHIKALMKSVSDLPRTEYYRNLHWFTYESEDTLVLGDVGCIFEIDSNRRFKSLNDKKDHTKNVFLPISSNKLLIGRNSSKFTDIDCKDVNLGIVSCSYEYFVCSECGEEISALIPLIGSNAGVLTSQEMESIVSSGFNKKLKPRAKVSLRQGCVHLELC